MHWAHQYIGRKWESGARGPETFDCWGLLWWCKKKHYNEDIPCYPGIDAGDLALVTQAIDSGANGGDWKELPAPVDGCAVAMSKHRRFHHVGIFIDVDGGLVLHAHDKSKVVAQTISSLRSSGFQRIEFFNYHGPHHRVQ